MRKAIDEYVQAIDIRKNDYDSYYKIGELLNQLGKKEEAITILTNLANKKPEYVNAKLLLGEVFYDKAEFKEAVNILLSALTYNEKDARIYSCLAINYVKLNDFMNSKINYEKVIELNQKSYISYYNLGQISLLYNELERAEKFFMLSANIDCLAAKSFFQLSRIQLIKKNNEDALNFINQAIHIDFAIMKRIDREPLFISIRKNIEIPKEGFQKEEKFHITRNEALTIEHLEKTYEIIERMGVQK